MLIDDVPLLVKYKANLNTYRFETPMHGVARMHQSHIDVLCDAGLDRFALDDKGPSPLDVPLTDVPFAGKLPWDYRHHHRLNPLWGVNMMLLHWKNMNDNVARMVVEMTQEYDAP